MQTLLQDLRFAARQIFKNPGFATVAILSLAFGIGATTSVFSVIHAVLMDPYPYRAADRMVHVEIASKERNGSSLIQVNRDEWQQLLQAHAVEDAFGVRSDFSQTMTNPDSSDLPISVNATFNTPNFFTFMGVPAALGREFTPSDLRNGEPQPVAVLSYLFWQRQFGGHQDILGKLIQIGERKYTVIGVVPRRFTWSDADIYLPGVPSADAAEHWLAFIRLRPSVTYPQAASELQTMVTRWQPTDTFYIPKDARVSVLSLNQQLLGEFQGTLVLLFSSVALLLMIGCANVSILMLAHGTSRRHEFAVRVSLGATRRRLMRQLLTESVLLSVAGAILGIGLAYGGVSFISAWLPADSFPHEAAIGVNLPVLVFTACICLVTGILFGIAPALQLSRPDIGQIMAQSATNRVDGASSGSRTRALLIVGQVTLTMLLLVFAGTTIRAFLALYHTSLGYDPDHAMVLNLNLPKVDKQNWQQRANQMEFLRQAVEHTPGVASAAVSVTYLPPFPAFDAPVEILGDPSTQPHTASLELLGPQALTVLRIPLLSGRMFNEEETARAAHVAVVNQAFVRQVFNGRDPIGHSVRSSALKVMIPNLLLADNPDGYLQIVGVIGDTRNEGIDHPAIPALILPYTFVLPPNLFLMVRTFAPTATVYDSMRRKMREVNPGIVPHDSHELTWFLWQQAWGKERFVASLFSGFALLALALAAAGLYSVVSYSVEQRTREFGIRMAMGARRSHVMRLAIRSAGFMVAVGAVFGVVSSLALNRVLTHWVQANSRDPLVLVQVILVMFAVTSIACALPAHRAASADPAKALRQD